MYMEQTLVLNATYEPLKVVDWQRAITLWCQGKVEIVETHDREVLECGTRILTEQVWGLRSPEERENVVRSHASGPDVIRERSSSGRALAP